MGLVSWRSSLQSSPLLGVGLLLGFPKEHLPVSWGWPSVPSKRFYRAAECGIPDAPRPPVSHGSGRCPRWRGGRLWPCGIRSPDLQLLWAQRPHSGSAPWCQWGPTLPPALDLSRRAPAGSQGSTRLPRGVLPFPPGLEGWGHCSYLVSEWSLSMRPSHRERSWAERQRGTGGRLCPLNPRI